MTAAANVKGTVRFLLLLGGIFVLTFPVMEADALAQRRGGARRVIAQPFMPGARSDAPPTVISIDESAPLSNLFQRAHDAAGRSDWKLAIDSLQRIVEDPNGALIRTSNDPAGLGSRWQSARIFALRGLRSLDPEGLRAYRLLYDGRAKGALARAALSYDVNDLHETVKHYPLTRHGAQAGLLLSSWALEEGRAAEALGILDELEELAFLEEQTRVDLCLQQIAARMLLGQSQAAAETADQCIALAHSAEVDVPWLSAVLEISPAREVLSSARDMPKSWPLRGGTASRQGTMPGVTPTIIDGAPWSYELPGATWDAWQRVAEDDPADRLELPAAFPLVADERLYVSGPGGVVALDRDSLSPIWTRVFNSSSGRKPPVQSMLEPIDSVDASDDVLYARFDDHVGQSISVVGDLLLAVDREESDLRFGPDGVEISTGVLAGRGFWQLGRNRSPSNRLVAYESATGEVRWHRGRTDDPSDPLRQVLFRAAPIAINELLWAVIQQGDQFGLVVLRPEDGSIKRIIPLGYLSDPGYAAGQSLDLAYSDGIVIVPSGRGVIFAVDARTYRPMWATRYVSTEGYSPVHRWDDPDYWLSCPPIIVGSSVIHAPSDDSALHAFSLTNGSLQWSSQRVGSSYLIAADDEHVWLGGRVFSCVRVANGQRVWSASVDGFETGRAIVAEGRVLIPIASGLNSLDAASGRRLVGESQRTETPLGNLLSFDGSLYSVDTALVRRFPDLDTAYARLRTKRADDPSDVVVAYRLAWLEYLRGELNTADDLLAGISFQSPLAEDALKANVASLQTRVLLDLAERDDVPQAQRKAYLDRAESIAQSPEDSLRVALAVADHMNASGSSDAAFRHLLETGRTVDPGMMLTVDPELQLPALTVIGGRLEKFLAEAPAGSRVELQGELRSIVNQLLEELEEGSRPRTVRHELMSMFRLDPRGPVGQELLLSMGQLDLKRERFEPAEQRLRHCIRVRASDDVELAARMELVELLMHPQQRRHREAIEILQQLQEDFHGQPVASRFAKPIPQNATVGAWVAHKLESLTGSGSPIAAAGTIHKSGFAGDARWSISATNRDVVPRMLHVPNAVDGVLANRLLLYSPYSGLECVNTSDNASVEWKAMLPEESTALLPNRAIPPWARAAEETSLQFAAVDGQTLIVPTSNAIHAVGVISGKRLWSIPYEPHGSAEVEDHGSWTRVSAGEGTVIYSPRIGKLTARRTLDGEIMWERDVREFNARYLRVVGDRVLATGASFERILVLDRRSGGQIASIEYGAPARADPAAEPIVQRGNLIVPRVESETVMVAAYDMDQGTQTWKLKLDAPMCRLFEADESTLGVGGFDGDIWLVDVDSGSLQGRFKFRELSRVLDGTLYGGTLVVEHADGVAPGSTASLAAVDPAENALIWSLDDAEPLAHFRGKLAVTGGVIPALLRHRDENRRGVARLLAMIDAKTGEPVGEMLHFLSGAANPPEECNGDWAIRQGCLAIGRAAVGGPNIEIRGYPLTGGEGR